MTEEGSMQYTLDPLGLTIDTSGPASLIVPVPDVPAVAPAPEAVPETETIRPEEIGGSVDISI